MLPIASFDEENLHKNGITQAEIRQVLASDLSCAEDLTPSERGNNRAMVIGWTYEGRLWEVGIEYFEIEDREHVFHAMDAGKSYRQEFARKVGQ